MSFLIPPDEFRDVITSAGFDIEVWNDKTDLAQKAFSQMTEPKGEPDLPELGVHMLVGHDILTKAITFIEILMRNVSVLLKLLR